MDAQADALAVLDFASLATGVLRRRFDLTCAKAGGPSSESIPPWIGCRSASSAMASEFVSSKVQSTSYITSMGLGLVASCASYRTSKHIASISRWVACSAAWA